MKKISAVLFALIIVLSFTSAVYGTDASVSAESAVLIEATTGRILFGKNEREFRPMASTTKIMSALLCLESGNLDEKLVVDAEAITVEGSSMGLVEGDVVTKRALCCGMLLPSGNDSANATAVAVAGSISDFAVMMNDRAEEIGMTDTHFVTPSGLDAEGHGSTAYDMAILTAEALKNPDFAYICSQESISLSFGNPPYDRRLYNTNKLLSMSEDCIGVKTGFTDEAGRCLVSAMERDGITLICVTLNAPDDWNDHLRLYEHGYSRVGLKTVNENGLAANVVGGDADTVALYSDDAEILVIDGETSVIEKKIVLPPIIYAPVTEGERVGEVQYYIDGKQIAVSGLYSSQGVQPFVDEEKTFIGWLKGLFG